MKPQKIENKNKNEERREVQSDMLHELPETEPWRNPEQGSQDTSKSSHELPMEPRAKVEQVRVSTVCIRTFRKTEIVTSA